MSRFKSASSYGHSVRKIEADFYRMSWTYDVHYAGSRLRHPRQVTRDTDEAGAKRFAKKWNIEIKDGRNG